MTNVSFVVGHEEGIDSIDLLDISAIINSLDELEQISDENGYPFFSR